MTTASAARFVALVIAQPLTPPDCSMKGFDYMPLMVDRLRGSRAWLSCKRRPELAYYMLNLWSASWKSVPAGSLEDDDDILADAAMCDPVLWPSIRADVMRGWLRCSFDGRLYHPVVCELAAKAWDTRVAYRKGAANARAAKAAKRGQRAQRPVQQPGLDLPIPESTAAENPFRETVENDDSPLEFQHDVAADASGPDLAPDDKCEVISEKKGERPLKTPRAKTRGSRLPDNWEPGAEGYRFAATLGLAPDDVLAAFTDHFRGIAGIRGQSCDWHATWREWTRGAAARARRERGFGKNSGGLTERGQRAMENIMRKQAEWEAKYGAGSANCQNAPGASVAA